MVQILTCWLIVHSSSCRSVRRWQSRRCCKRCRAGWTRTFSCPSPSAWFPSPACRGWIRGCCRSCCRWGTAGCFCCWLVLGCWLSSFLDCLRSFRCAGIWMARLWFPDCFCDSPGRRDRRRAWSARWELRLAHRQWTGRRWCWCWTMDNPASADPALADRNRRTLVCWCRARIPVGKLKNVKQSRRKVRNFSIISPGSSWWLRRFWCWLARRP